MVNDQSLRFFALGDFGGEPIWPYYSPVQRDIAASMEKLGTERNTHFQIELGDNFYVSGVADINDVRWKVRLFNCRFLFHSSILRTLSKTFTLGRR